MMTYRVLSSFGPTMDWGERRGEISHQPHQVTPIVFGTSAFQPIPETKSFARAAVRGKRGDATKKA